MESGLSHWAEDPGRELAGPEQPRPGSVHWVVRARGSGQFLRQISSEAQCVVLPEGGPQVLPAEAGHCTSHRSLRPPGHPCPSPGTGVDLPLIRQVRCVVKTELHKSVISSHCRRELGVTATGPALRR